MEIIPPVHITRFEQLRPGDLFVYPHERGSCFALKTERPANGDRSPMVVLGPDFPYGVEESFILDWQPTTVISHGSNYVILLPADPAAWFLSGNLRNPVCIAITEDGAYVCTNGGHSPQHFFQCFVEFSTGRLVEGRLPSYAAYTNDWEIATYAGQSPLRTLLRHRRKGGNL